MNIASLLRKKWVLAVVAAGIVGTAGYAFAATLGITSGSLGAGNTTVASCIPSDAPASTSYTTQWNTTDKAFDVQTVTVKLVEGDNCVPGDIVQIALQDGSNAALATGQHVLTDDDVANKTFTYTYSATPTDGAAGQFGPSTVSAAAVNGVAVSAVGKAS